jgi:hypothetical protein
MGDLRGLDQRADRHYQPAKISPQNLKNFKGFS